MLTQDRWSNSDWRRVYYRTYKQYKAGKLGEHVNLVELTDKRFNELCPQKREKQVHPDLRVLDERGRRNPERETALYLRNLCRDEDKPDDFVTVQFNVPNGQESNPLIHHPRVNIKRRRKQVNELPSSGEW